MFFSKFPHPANFSFCAGLSDNGSFTVAQRQFKYSIEQFEGGISRFKVNQPDLWDDNRNLVELIEPAQSPIGVLSVNSEGDLVLSDLAENHLLSSKASRGFGVSSKGWMFQFDIGMETRFYGMGEKHLDTLELSGKRSKFWNTDVWGDFHGAQIVEHPVDPAYAAIPYLILYHKGVYIGILNNTPHVSYIQTPGRDTSQAFMAWQQTVGTLLIGAYDGEPDLWFIVGPTLKELTRKLSALVGRTPLPPVWSLGYHQCKWGYKGEKDLHELEAEFEKLQFPVDGLWLDIDYMDGFRVFTTSKEHFPNGVKKAVEPLQAKGRRIIPILDPGVKLDPGFEVYEDGVKKDIFCYNSEAKHYVGIVWPGETVFPDFTLKEGRDWWAGYAKKFIESGFDAAWVDMNDPSTGPVEPDDLLFNRGKEPHIKFRNHYALGMQMATYDGFLAAKPNERPFILSRSASTGTSRYSAVWTGDNFSNYYHLAMSIPTVLNLGLSGIPFNSPDMGGFGGHPSPQLMTDWTKACFLYPFFRNHSGGHPERQEPWCFPTAVTEVLRHYVRLRYKFLPYIYNLYYKQMVDGDPMMRPLFYEFPVDEETAVMKDQFMIGSNILQAPVLNEEGFRNVHLPGGQAQLWWEMTTGIWASGGEYEVAPKEKETPFYVREGAIIPLSRGIATTNKTDLLNPDVLVAFSPTSVAESSDTYFADDGISFHYEEGGFSMLKISAKCADRTLEIQYSQERSEAGKITPQFIIPAGWHEVFVNGKPCEVQAEQWAVTGADLAILRVLA